MHSLGINWASFLTGAVAFCLVFLPVALLFIVSRTNALKGQIAALKNEEERTIKQLSYQEEEAKEKQQELQQEILSLRNARQLQAEASVLANERAVQLQALTHSFQQTSQELAKLQTKNAELMTRLEEERKNTQEKITFAEEAKQKLLEAFGSLAANALHKNNQTFLHLAQSSLTQFQEHAKVDLGHRQKEIADLVTPVKQALSNVDQKLQELEKERMSAYQVLRQQVHDLIQGQQQLRTETSHLVQALKAPNVRGRWGEMQLKRVVEMAGMIAYCDFFEQVSNTPLEGEARLRPDMIIRLPGGKKVVVDAKAPLYAYLEAIEAKDETEKKAKYKDHARQVKNHITVLSRRAYWEQFDPTPDFVIMFLPGEMFFSAALEQDPSLIEAGVQEKVILATPTTLIAMLRAIAYGWRQEKLTANAKEIGDLGRELYKRLADMGSHVSRLGKNLGTTVDAYNQMVGTLEKRVLVTARRFQQLETMPEGIALTEGTPLDHTPRSISSIELRDEGEENETQTEAALFAS